MATSFALTVSLILSGQLDNPNALTLPTDPIDQLYKQEFANGTGAGQADQVWHEQRTIAASSTFDLDLEGGLTDAFGAAINPARVAAIVVKAAAGNTNNVIIGNAAANQFVGWFGAAAHTVAVRPGGLFVMMAPGTSLDSTLWPTTAATADILRFANSAAGTSVTYDVWLVLKSA